MVDGSDIELGGAAGGIIVLVILIVVFLVQSVPVINKCEANGGVIARIHDKDLCIDKNYKEIKL